MSSPPAATKGGLQNEASMALRRLLIGLIIAAPDFRGKDSLLRRLLEPLTGDFLRSGYRPWLRVRGADLTNRFALRCTHNYDRVWAEVERLRAGMAFLDIGANAGIFSLVAARRVGPSGAVIAFEPAEALFADLLANLARNGASNVHPFNLAVGSESGTIRFEPGPPGHSGVARISADGPCQVKQIGPADLVDLIEPLIGRRRTMVKIDVEGAEGLAVAALAPLLRRPQVTSAIVEIDPVHLSRYGTSPDVLYARMATMGFVPFVGLGAFNHYDEIFTKTGGGPRRLAPEGRKG